MSDLAAAPLGVFDSGVGGLSVLKELRRALPREDLMYLGDTARVPYGSKPLDMVRGFARGIADELIGRGVKGIVIACNTASAASLPALADELPVPVWGVIEPGVRAALLAAPGGRVGVLGTQGTIRARAYQDRLEAAGATTWARACPLFVPIVEEGVSDSAIATLVARHYLEDRPELDAVILGCTHYPFLKPVLRAVLGEASDGSPGGGPALVDSAEETAAAVAADLAAAGLRSDRERPGRVLHLVSGDVPSYRHALVVLDGPDGPVERIRWEAGPDEPPAPRGSDSTGSGSTRSGPTGSGAADARAPAPSRPADPADPDLPR